MPFSTDPAQRTAGALLPTLFASVAMLVLGLAPLGARAQTLNWMQWTAPAGYPANYTGGPTPYAYVNGASGLLTLPDSSVVTVALTGEVAEYSCFETLITSCPAGWWRSTARGWGPNTQYPVGTFTSANVPTVPNTANLVTQAGYVPSVARHTLTFSQPVTNIVMTIVSLGGTTGQSAYQFDQDFMLLSQHPSCAGAVTDAAPQNNCLTVHGRTLTGREGSGALQFTGTFTSISWEVTVPEVYSGFNVGVTSASFTAQDPLVLAATPTAIPAGGTSTLSTTGGSGPGAVGYTLVSGPCTLSGTTLTGTSAGACELTATKAGDGIYASLTSNAVTVTVVPSHAVTYNANGATSGAAPGSQFKGDGIDLTLAGAGGLVRTGYTFSGWNTAADGSGTPYALGASYTADATLTLFAQWTAVAAAPVAIPTLSTWLQILLALLLCGLAARQMRRR